MTNKNDPHKKLGSKIFFYVGSYFLTELFGHVYDQNFAQKSIFRQNGSRKMISPACQVCPTNLVDSGKKC